MSGASPSEKSADFSEEFYRLRSSRFSDISHQLIQSVYVQSSHPALRGDLDLLERLKELISGRRGLDAGCGAGARDVYDFWSSGYDICGIDAIEENVQVTRRLHPEIADRVSVADLRYPLDFAEKSFDFVICNAVIQHIEPEHVFEVTLRELVRVLKPGGILQLMFKNGHGVKTVFDRDYGVNRSFQLYDEQKILLALGSTGMSLLEGGDPDLLGGIMHFTDTKQMQHCAFFARKAVQASDP